MLHNTIITVQKTCLVIIIIIIRLRKFNKIVSFFKNLFIPVVEILALNFFYDSIKMSVRTELPSQKLSKLFYVTVLLIDL